MKNRVFSTKMLATMGLLVALEVVIARFGTIRPTQSIKLSLDFIPIVVAGILYGPIPALIISILADILGAFLFPVGPFFPGFTLTAALTGLLYGAVLHRSQAMPRVILAVVLHQCVLSLLLNTYWLRVLYGLPYLPTLVGRLVQCGIMAALQILIIPILARVAREVERRVLA